MQVGRVRKEFGVVKQSVQHFGHSMDEADRRHPLPPDEEGRRREEIKPLVQWPRDLRKMHTGLKSLARYEAGTAFRGCPEGAREAIRTVVSCEKELTKAHQGWSDHVRDATEKPAKQMIDRFDIVEKGLREVQGKVAQVRSVVATTPSQNEMNARWQRVEQWQMCNGGGNSRRAPRSY